MIKYLFSINCGRSGSKYLSSLFSHVVNCAAFHEPPPAMNARFISSFNNMGNRKFLDEMMMKKVEQIQSSMIDHDLYVETNHTFIKGFGWELTKYIPAEEIGVIVLKRDKEKIINSLLKLHCTPLTKIGKDWLFHPLDKLRLADLPSPEYRFRLKYHVLKFINTLYYKFEKNLPGKPSFISAFERQCLNWYIEESSARTDLFKESFSGIRFLDVDLDDLNKEDAIENILVHFDLNMQIKPSLLDAVNKPANRKSYVPG